MSEMKERTRSRWIRLRWSSGATALFSLFLFAVNTSSERGLFYKHVQIGEMKGGVMHTGIFKHVMTELYSGADLEGSKQTNNRHNIT